jgi:hypothetical protein
VKRGCQQRRGADFNGHWMDVNNLADHERAGLF